MTHSESSPSKERIGKRKEKLLISASVAGENGLHHYVQQEVDIKRMLQAPSLTDRFPPNIPKMRPSRRLYVPAAQGVTVVCADTGIISLLQVPSIGHGFLTYSHPLAILENARTLAQRGKEYLLSCDSQILAGILLVLANDYNLFSFSGQHTSVQKNSLLRAVDKGTLVDCIMTIEQKVHSGNFYYLPRLSFQLDGEPTLTGEFARRIAEWLSSTAIYLVEALVKQADEKDRETIENAFYGKVPVRTMEAPTVRGAKAKAERERIEANKLLRTDKKSAIEIVATLKKEGLLRDKLLTFLTGLFQGDALISLPADKKTKLLARLEEIEHVNMATLLTIIKRKREAISLTADDLWEDTEPANKLVRAKQETTAIATESTGLMVSTSPSVVSDSASAEETEETESNEATGEEEAMQQTENEIAEEGIWQGPTLADGSPAFTLSYQDTSFSVDLMYKDLYESMNIIDKKDFRREMYLMVTDDSYDSPLIAKLEERL